MSEENKELMAMEHLPQKLGATEIQAQARAQAEIQSAIIAAKRWPRDEEQCFVRIIKSMERPSMADAAEYEFPRGGQKVSGPTIKLMREFSRIWGNCRSGFRVVDSMINGRDTDFVLLMGYAYDLETGTYKEYEDRFRPRVQRKLNGKTEWVIPDERDLRELTNSRGSRLERNALRAVLPPDMVDEACKKADDTLSKAAKGQLEINREDSIRQLALRYAKVGVSTEILVKWLGHELKLIGPDKFAELMKALKSIEAGTLKREEFFEIAPVEKADDLADKIKGAKAEQGKEPLDARTNEGQTNLPIITPENIESGKTEEKKPTLSEQVESRLSDKKKS